MTEISPLPAQGGEGQSEGRATKPKLLTPALSSFGEEREKKTRVFHQVHNPGFRRFTTGMSFIPGKLIFSSGPACNQTVKNSFPFKSPEKQMGFEGEKYFDFF